MAASQPTVPAGDTLAVALGANLGDPAATLVAVRPLLQVLLEPLASPGALCHWSPLFRTAPVGGPPDQPDYLNAVVLLERPWPEADPLALLAALQELERRFGRERRERWGPRLLDLDLLWCGTRRLQEPALELPHPRLHQRRFVLEPLAAIDPALCPPGCGADPGPSVADLLAQLQMASASVTAEPPPERLPPRPGWPE